MDFHGGRESVSVGMLNGASDIFEGITGDRHQRDLMESVGTTIRKEVPGVCLLRY